MKKKKTAKFDPKWMKDLITGKRKETASDNSFLEHNGSFWKLFGQLVRVLNGKRH